jgi:hypothetical protein
MSWLDSATDTQKAKETPTCRILDLYESAGIQRIEEAAIRMRKPRRSGPYGKYKKHKENPTSFKSTHGHTSGGVISPTYTSWSCMVGRCYHHSSPNYQRYGGVGIAVCDKWRKFEGFLADMGERPVGHTLDRIDGTKDYEKDNCRWATPGQQAANRRKQQKS